MADSTTVSDPRWVLLGMRTFEAVQALAQDLHVPPAEVIDTAVEALRRQHVLEQTNAVYAALRRDPARWQAVIEEREEWDALLTDDEVER